MPDMLIEILSFFLVAAGTLVAERWVGQQLSVRRRLTQDATATKPSALSILKANAVTNPALLWVQSATAPTNPEETTKLRRDLALAGFESPSASIWYVICRFALAVGLPLLLMLVTALAGKPLAGLGAIMFPLALCGIGLAAPYLFVRNRAGSRRQQVEHQFPDALDLMVVCVEAGLGLEAAFVRVAREVVESHPRIAEEFTRLANELGAGRGRADALRNLANRVDVESISAFVALVVQSDSLGVSVAQSLRTYSGEMREARFLKAEEKAMRIPVLMTIPIVACFMPVVIVALLLPPALDLIRTLAPTMSGQTSYSQPAAFQDHSK